MKVAYVEGIANHNGRQSCGAAREGDDEALTPTPWRKAEGNTGCTAYARRNRTPRGQRPQACSEAPCPGKHLAGKLRSAWWWSTATAYLPEYNLRLRRLPNADSRRAR